MDDPNDVAAAVVDQSADALILADGAGSVVRWNAAATALLARSPEETVGRPLLDVAADIGATPEDLARIRRALAGEVVRYEARRTIPGVGERLLSIVFSPVRDGRGGLAAVLAVVRDLTPLFEAERARDRGAARARFLAEASRLLAESLDLERTLEAIGELMVPAWADLCVLALRHADGRLRPTTVVSADPERQALVRDLFEEHAVDPLPGGLVESVLRGGSTVLVRDYVDRFPVGSPGGRRGLRGLGARSLVIAPLRVRGRVLGALFAAMSDSSERRFSEDDRDLVQDLADRAAQAIDNARLYRAEQEARAAAQLAEAAAREAEERFRAAFDHAPTGVALVAVDPDGRPCLTEVNPALCRIMGRSREELLGGPAEFLTAGELEDARGERRLLRADGEERWVQVRTAPLGAGARDTLHVAQVQDVTERRRFERELEHLASRDPLTGLLNRRRFAEELDRALAGARRHGDAASVIAIDLDNFKHVNDTYGHGTGDELLRAAAAALCSRVRDTDAVGRLGGDEFGIVLARSGPDEAAAVARDLLDAFRHRVGVAVGDYVVRVTASAGVRALDPDSGATAAQLLSEADMALYDAKERGRDRLSAAGEPDAGAERLRTRMRWAERVRHALDTGRFVLHEQPILRLADDRVDRAELLIRMVDDEDGRLVAPADFLEVAERFGHIRAIDRWVVCQAVALLAGRQAAGVAIGAGVNLSGDSLSDASVVDFVVAEIRNAAIDPSLLTFEVTETAAIGNLERARRLAVRLTELGCGFALDDFGAGFGSFAYLKHLPLDLIKIDGEFIRSLPSNEPDQVTVRAIVDVARALGKETVAEFVEDADTLELLRRLGVDRAQGHHVGRPRPVRVRPEF